MSTVLGTAIEHYVSDSAEHARLLEAVPAIEAGARGTMLEAVKAKEGVRFQDIVAGELKKVEGLGTAARQELTAVLDKLPLAYSKVHTIFRVPETKQEGAGGLFSIFVSGLCKGCGECVIECGSRTCHGTWRNAPYPPQESSQSNL